MASHSLDIYIIMDFIPNHTSDHHKWFKESAKNDEPDNPYRDYYVWYPSKDSKTPPNNWVSFCQRHLFNIGIPLNR